MLSREVAQWPQELKADLAFPIRKNPYPNPTAAEAPSVVVEEALSSAKKNKQVFQLISDERIRVQHIQSQWLDTDFDHLIFSTLLKS